MNDSNITPCVLALEENSMDVYLETSTVLLKLADNVLKEPSNQKYRSIRLSNPTVANKLISSIGAMECLFTMGFQEGDDSLVLPTNFVLGNLKKIRDEIFQRRNNVVKNSTKSTPANERYVPKSSVRGLAESSPQSGEVSLTTTEQHQMATSSSCSAPTRLPTHQDSLFLNKIEHNFQAVLQYEDKRIQAEARQLIPITELEIAAMNDMRKLQLAIKQGKTKEIEGDIQDFVLIELLNWFKVSFFKWVDAPECEHCQGVTKFNGVHTNNSNPKDTYRVEVYECTLCNRRTLFPRYNDVAMLLKTRRGRCGEWANCFTLFCRTFGWDARHVVDETDHVWTEVYSGAQGRWLHCDPCENVLDTPLMYEYGWGKKLSYVIAYSRDDIQDVTWRYSSNHSKIISHRTKCSETTLLATITRLRTARQTNLSSARRAFLEKRLVKELVEFLIAKHPTEMEQGGRISGSLAWRMARGETGPEETEPYVWAATSDEVKLGKMQVKYSASQDKYIRPTLSASSQCYLNSFQNGAFEVRHILRKEEDDWKKVYLARTEGSDTSTIKWKFDIGEQDVVVDRVRVVVQSQVFENGQILWLLCGENSCVRINSDETAFETEALSGNSSVILSAELSGGSGRSAWQHTQLFRQDTGDNENFPMDITVTFRHK